MTAVVAPQPLSLLDEPVGGEPTLDEVLARVWEELAAHRSAPCPVCGAQLTPDRGRAGGEFAGACRGCGSTLH